MLYTLGVLAFVLGLLGSIALHEVGHLVPAKRFGVRVTQYMVGFGPTLWSRRRGETEYGVKAVPLGGYIKMIGMVPPSRDGGTSRWPGRLAELVEEFRLTSRTEVTDTDGDRQFYRLTPGKKIVVMLGGPMMNLLIFLILTVLLYGAIGAKGATSTVASVSTCVVPATAAAAATDTCPVNATPAPAAGVLKPGDVITAIDGLQITQWSKAVTVIETSANKQLTITVQRNGSPVTVQLTPVQNTKYANAQGTKTKQAGFIGISTTQAYQRYTPAQIVTVIGQQIRIGVDALGAFPAKIGSLWQTVFQGKARDVSGAVGVVGLGRIGGQIAADSSISTLDRISVLLSLIAGVNLLLFFFNLLPLLPLDGGHVAGALVEAVKRGRARVRNRRLVAAGQQPALRSQIYVDVAQLMPIMYVVAGLLVAFSVLVLYADIVKPINLNG